MPLSPKISGASAAGGGRAERTQSPPNGADGKSATSPTLYGRTVTQLGAGSIPFADLAVHDGSSLALPGAGSLKGSTPARPSFAPVKGAASLDPEPARAAPAELAKALSKEEEAELGSLLKLHPVRQKVIDLYFALPEIFPRHYETDDNIGRADSKSLYFRKSAALHYIPESIFSKWENLPVFCVYRWPGDHRSQ